MSILTPEQQVQLSQCSGGPLRLLDPATNREYVLLEAAAYEHLQSLLDAGDPREFYPALQRAMQDERWDDPRMEEYN